jgi:predicted metal-dependent phosphoesterase TrpH
VIPAIELSTTLNGSELHMLGYFIDPENPQLVAHAEHAIGARRARVQRMLELLRAHAIHVTFEEVIAAAEGIPRVLGRPHVARALHKKGYVQTPAEAFDRFIGDSGPCFLPTELLHPQAAIAMIRGAGGVAVWAHPRPDMMQRELESMVEWGVRGLECFRPRASSDDIAQIQANAARHDLLVSGGSDWHGTWHGRLGDFYVDGADVGAFLEVGGL